jgi:hypothetical protein
MGTIRFEYERFAADGNLYDRLPQDEFNKFNPSILNLGDISKDGQYFEALAAIFDLEAFTSFSNQIDPHLVIPEYLNEFLNWLFQSISTEIAYKVDGQQALLWCPFPFFAKFLGDGVLFLWDTRKFDPYDYANVVVSLLTICNTYTQDFLPQIKKRVSKPPVRLRCGIARGQVISIGEENDFVGPCINVAARLQKLGQFSFAFSKRGFNVERYFHEGWKDHFVLIKSQIRGVGDEELLYVLKTEYQQLSAGVKKELLP